VADAIPAVIHSRKIFLFLAGMSLLLAACGRGQEEDNAERAYVIAPQVTLRDRVAAVYNKVGAVYNGEKVRVLDRSQNRRFVKVRTASGTEGWMEQRYLVGQAVYDGFAKLAKDHANTPGQAQAVTRRIVNLHVSPARDGETLYQLKEGAKIELLERATTPKSGIKKSTAQTEDEKDKERDRGEEDDPKAAVADPLEDWWLVRDSDKHVGWMLGRMLDIEIPLEIAQYAEGQRIVAAFVLNEVPATKESEKKVPQYAVLMSEPKDGLPFDFNQVRVFTWNPAKTRYETAYRERLTGELPFRVTTEDYGKEGKLPTFFFRAQDKAGEWQERKYKLNGPIVRKVAALAPNDAKSQAASPAKRPGQ
jgi:hypothetical protein